MSKTSTFTTITPLPKGITRQSVIDMYHNHVEMIELNPLVIERFKCKAPSYASAEEFHATWYTIKDKVSYLPGGLASGSVSYHACFHDLPDALQTHVYAPLGLDIKAKWTVGGNLPGEPKQAVELGLGIPRDGLYIREDVKMKCNIMMISFVKKTFKESHSKLVDRLVEKAHIIESKVANERMQALRQVAPGERMGGGEILIAPPPGYDASLHAQNPHMSMYSNSSGQAPSHASPMSSPALLPATTYGSPHPGSPPVPYGSFDNRVSYNPDQKYEYDPRVSYQPGQMADPRVSAYVDPRSANAQGGYAYHAFQPPPAELDSEGPPVPPKNDEKKLTAELPA